MASVTKINGTYHARVRRKGHKAQCRSFSHKADALKWVVETERAIQLGALVGNDCTFGELLKRYVETVSPAKKSAEFERQQIAMYRRSWIGDVLVSKLSANHIAQFRDERLRKVSASSCLRDLGILSHVLNVAMREWGFSLSGNPVAKIRKPKPNKPRARRLEGDEGERLIVALLHSGNIWIVPLVKFAIETAMRRGELLALRWENVHLDRRFAHLPDTKNGESRDVPLSVAAIEILRNLPRDISGRVFPIHFEAIKSLWRRAIKRAGIVDLHFHDLRHEGTSRLFEKGLNVMEVASITGHKDVRMLRRYTHLRAEDLALKLA